MSQLSRRQFLGTTAAGVIAATSLGRAGEACHGAAETRAAGGYSKTKVLRIFMGSRPAWPRPDLDIQAEMQRQKAEIDKVKGLEDVEWVSDAYVGDDATLAKLLAEHKDVDGILAVQVCMGTGGMLHKMANSGIPTCMFGIPYSGHEWTVVPELQRAGKKIDCIPSSDFADVNIAIRPFRAIHRMKETKILYISGGPQAPAAVVDSARKQFGIEIKTIEPKQLLAVYDAVKAEAAAADAERWIRNALEIREPSKEEILRSARMCVALRQILADEKAQAITINCLGLFAQKVMPAYPCFGFSRLNDLGLTGVCEADLASTLTQVIYLHLTGKPGFVTDPMFDTSKGTVIHAHCVAATKMDGPTGEAAPYLIRSHLEDHKGAVLQVKMRVGQEITMAKLITEQRKAQPAVVAASPAESLGTGVMLASTGTIVGVPDSESACRTKIEVKVKDARKMFEGWSYGLHRVIFYGNHMDDTRRLARFTGFNIVEEG
jgi:hypothetical protein